MREIARLIERPVNSYAAYESEAKFKKDFIPIDLVKDLEPHFKLKGVSPSELYALAGIEKDVLSKFGEGGKPKSLNKSTENNFLTNVPVSRRYDDAAEGVDLLEVDMRAGAGGGAIGGFSRDGNGFDLAAVKFRWNVPKDWLRGFGDPNSLFLFEVVGDSMLPTFPPRTKVVVDSSDTWPSPPGAFVVWDGFSFVLKKVDPVPHSDPLTVILKSTNPDYSDYERVLDEAYIQGRVVGFWANA